MYCVGLTGNIASGKSTVAQYFKELGVEVISADQIAKEITASNQPAFHKITKYFGQSVINSEGELNRRYLRKLIFNSVEKRQWLEKLLHPLIRQRIEEKVAECQGPYCLIEIPLLLDKETYPYLNRILLVLADREQQIARLMARDNCSQEDALLILASQADETQHRAIADDILLNHGSTQELQQQVSILHEQYLERASKLL